MVILNKAFNKDPSWSRETVQYLKNHLDLKTSQIYKWGYDRKKNSESEKQANEDMISSINNVNDQAMTDSRIQDYNDAVNKILDHSQENNTKQKGNKWNNQKSNNIQKWTLIKDNWMPDDIIN